MDSNLLHKRIAVLWGGWSDERPISRESAQACFEALMEAGFTSVEMLDVAERSCAERLTAGEFDVAFVAMHGPFGEDGCIQGLLEILHIPFTFSGVLASAMASDKEISRWVYEENGIPLAKGTSVRDASSETIERVLAELELPLFVKPAVNGSSHGVSKVREAAELGPAIALALQSSNHAVVEEAVSGMEITVPVIGGKEPQALSVIEVVTGAEFYDLKVKYEPSELHHVIPARLPEETLAEAQRLAVLAHTALGCWGASRSDFIVTADGTPVILETNTIPGMTRTSLLPDSAARTGIPFPELVKRFVAWALEKPVPGAGALPRVAGERAHA